MKRAALFCLIAFASAPAQGDRLKLSHYAVDLHPENADIQQIGALTFRGGLELGSDDSRFGGLSGLLVAGDGRTMIAVGDKGHWVSMRLDYDDDGRLAGAGDGRIGAIASREAGRAVRGGWRDAEALARMGESILVAFEGRHRIWRYEGGSAALARPPRRFPTPREIRHAPGNGGMEALTALADGRLLAISEKLAVFSDQVGAWLWTGKKRRPARYQRSGQFYPTGAATLPNGDVLVLERRFTWVGGVASRIVRISGSEIRPGAWLRDRSALHGGEFRGHCGACRTGRDGADLSAVRRQFPFAAAHPAFDVRA